MSPALLAFNAALVLLLPPQPGHPRNSEGSFAELRDGRILFAYSHYVGEDWQDHARAVVATRESSDGGRTWSKRDRVIVANEGDCNVMSVSFLRLSDSRLALFYVRKNSARDCRLHMRLSTDEGGTWGAPTLCNPTEGYFVTNNDRVVQLASGRLVAPAAFHRPNRSSGEIASGIDLHGEAVFFLSDDLGQNWRESRQRLRVGSEIKSGLQEPGVIERRDGSLYGWARTDAGQQWEFESHDGGDTWTEPRPSRFRAPCSPLSIRNVGSPATPIWLAIWNEPDAGRPGEPASWGRTPLVAAWSRDEGTTWSPAVALEDDRARGFCYTAIHRAGDAVLLAYCCGGRGSAVLQDLCIKRLTNLPPALRL